MIDVDRFVLGFIIGVFARDEREEPPQGREFLGRGRGDGVRGSDGAGRRASGADGAGGRTLIAGTRASDSMRRPIRGGPRGPSGRRGTGRPCHPRERTEGDRVRHRWSWTRMIGPAIGGVGRCCRVGIGSRISSTIGAVGERRSRDRHRDSGRRRPATAWAEAGMAPIPSMPPSARRRRLHSRSVALISPP